MPVLLLSNPKLMGMCSIGDCIRELGDGERIHANELRLAEQLSHALQELSRTENGPKIISALYSSWRNASFQKSHFLLSANNTGGVNESYFSGSGEIAAIAMLIGQEVAAKL